MTDYELVGKQLAVPGEFVLEQRIEGRWHIIRRGDYRRMMWLFHVRSGKNDHEYRVRPVEEGR